MEVRVVLLVDLGVAYTTGLGWVLLSMAQLPAGYFVFMVLGKKFAILARKNNYVLPSLIF